MSTPNRSRESETDEPEAVHLSPGTVLANRYEIKSLLGEGGMGSVYKAHDRFLDEEVALKLLRPGFASTAEATLRFRSEIKLARKVTHRNVCRIHEYSEVEGIRFLSMEYVEGSNLKDLVRGRGGLAPDDAREVAIQIARGLQAIHDRGIIHRDMKTANIMRDPQGEIRLMDFGIAKQWGQERGGEGLTGVGDALGTPEYMSPEQARGQTLDFRSDIYSLGVCLFELLTGELPFMGKSALDTLIKHLQEPPPITTAIAAEFHPILEKALAKEPGDRYASARGLIADLRALGPEGRPGDSEEPAFETPAPGVRVAAVPPPQPEPPPAPAEAPVAARAEVDPAEVEKLVAMLRNPEVSFRWRAAVGLCQLGPGAAAALPAIEEAMDDAAPAVADAALEAYRAITGDAAPSGQHHRPGTEPTRPGLTTLLAQLRDKDTLVRWRAAVALGEAGIEAGEEATPSLVEALDDADSNVRSAAAMALGKMGAGAAAAVRPLAAALSDEDDTIFRGHAARALGRIGPAAHEAVPGLIAALCDEEASVRDEITEALVSIGSAALPALLEALQDDDPRVRYEAAHAVTRLGTSPVSPGPNSG